VAQAAFSKKQFVFHQQTGLKFKEETRKELNLEHDCVRRWNLDTGHGTCIRNILKVLKCAEKDGED